MTNDLSDTTLAKSDQLDAIDLLGHPRTFTITKVTKVEIEGQKRTEISLAEFPRVWRPSTNMRRVLLQVWGKDGDAYVGRQIRLYDDEAVTFGKERTGGIRISHMSHIDGTKDPQIMPSRGKYGTWHVEPLTESQPAPESAKSQPAPDKGLRTDAQSKALWMLAGKVMPDKDEFRRWLSGGLGRVVESTKALTKVECAEAIDALTGLLPPDGPNIASAAS